MTNSIFDHFLVTRFNVVLDSPTFVSDKKGNPTTTNEWLSIRFDLFDRYTIPSIKNQTCTEFKWLVLFNSQTPDSYKAKIALYSDIVPQFIPIYVDPTMDPTDALLKYIASNSNKEYIITTRLDNDDVIHRDYISKIQEAFTPSSNKFISFISGIQYSENRKTALKYNFIRNHYISRVEKRESAKSILCHHKYIHSQGELSIHNDKYMWVEIIHENNVNNKELVRPAIHIADTASIYGVELEHAKVKNSIPQLAKHLKIEIKSVAERFKCYLGQCKYRRHCNN